MKVPVYRTDEVQDYIKRNIYIKSRSEMIRDLGLSRTTVVRAIEYAGLRDVERSLNCNRTVDENIMSDAVNWFYFVGFIMADGCIKRGKLVEIRLSVKDEDFLREIAEWLKYKGTLSRAIHTAPNGKDYETVTLTFTSKKICDELKRYGIDGRKTGRERYQDIPDDYFIHFLRGFMDGDGNISQGSIRLYSRGEILEQILKDVKRLYRIEGVRYKRRDVQCIGFRKKDSCELARRMYRVGICLKRKKVMLWMQETFTQM